MTSSATIGKWRITKADLWDKDYLDMVEPAFIEFTADRRGEFRFGCIVATFECEYSPTTVHFRWHGFDEMDKVSGHGFAESIQSNSLAAEISFDNGDEADLAASKW